MTTDGLSRQAASPPRLSVMGVRTFDGWEGSWRQYETARAPATNVDYTTERRCQPYGPVRGSWAIGGRQALCDVNGRMQGPRFGPRHCSEVPCAPGPPRPFCRMGRARRRGYLLRQLAPLGSEIATSCSSRPRRPARTWRTSCARSAPPSSAKSAHPLPSRPRTAKLPAVMVAPWRATPPR